MSERSYQIEHALGRGGYGTVYQARYLGDGGFEKLVAVKVLNDHVNNPGELGQRLRDEARILGLVRHRAIVNVDRLVRLDGRWAVVMELVDGVDLRDMLLFHERLPVAPTLEMIAEVAGALHTAYFATSPDGRLLALQHRDIKPSNIRITGAGEVKLLDFGIARADFEAREALTSARVFGTPSYVAPERLELREHPHGDVYSIGAVLYEALTGAKLGRTTAHRDAMTRLVDRAMERLSTLLTPDEQPVVELTRGMLSFAPADRPTLREVEGRCISLVRRLGGAPLRFWAEETVPTIQRHSARPQRGEWTGRIAISSSHTAPPNLQPSPMQLRSDPRVLGGARTDWSPSHRGTHGGALETLPPTPAPAPPGSPTHGRTTAPMPAPATRQVPDPTRPDLNPTGAMAEPPYIGPPARTPTVALDVAPRPGPGALLGWIAGLTLVFAIVLGGSLWWGSGNRSPQVPAPRTAGDAPAPAAPDPAPTPETVAPQPDPEGPATTDPPMDPTPTPADDDAVEAGPEARPNPTPAAPTRAPRKRPSPKPATVRVAGDAARVILVASTGRRHTTPGPVPPGTYTIIATFPGSAPAAVGTTTVATGEAVVIRCDQRFGLCSAGSP